MTTFVMAVDGMFYKDPVFYGPDWFLAFPGDDPPEVVVERCRDAAAKAVDVLSAAGIAVRELYSPSKGRRCFYPGKDLRPAVAFLVDVAGPTPVPDKHYGAYELPTEDYVLYSWSET